MANQYYTHTTFPASNSQGASAGMRAELDAVMAAFDLLPDPLGVGLKGFSDGTWQNGIIQNSTIDGSVIGGTAAAAATFTSVLVGGAAVLAGGGTFSGTFAAGTAGKFTGFGISGGSLDNTPIGATTPNTIKGTTLTATGVTTLQSTLNVAGAVNFLDGVLELGPPASAGSPFIDFHSSGASSDYDARIIASGGSATAGQGAIGLFAAAITMSVRPSWGATPWDSTNLAAPFQNTGGNLNGDVIFRNATGATASPRVKFNPGDVAGPSIQGFISSGLKYFGVTDSAQANYNMTVRDDGYMAVRGGASFGTRPSWGLGYTPWDNQNLTNLSQLANGPGYLTAGGTIANAGLATRASTVLNDAAWMSFHWQGLGGTPQWVWGPNGQQGQTVDTNNTYLWNPAAWTVNAASFATQAGNVNGVSNPATAGARVQWDSGVAELGAFSAGQAVDAPAPYVTMGARGASAGGGMNFIWHHVVVLRNQ